MVKVFQQLPVAASRAYLEKDDTDYVPDFLFFTDELY
jgi:hypothetical protein